MSLEPAFYSRSSSISRADSPLLGFTLQEIVSPDPLHQPSPNYVRRLPEGALPNNKDKQSLAPVPDARTPTEQEILLTRNRSLHNQNRYFARLTLLRSRPAPAHSSRQPFVLPRARSHHVVLRRPDHVASRRPSVASASQLAAKSPLPPTNGKKPLVLPRARSHHVVLGRPDHVVSRRPSVASTSSSQPAAKPPLSPTHEKKPFVLPRARSHHVVVRHPAVAKSPLPPTHKKNTSTPAAPVSLEDASRDLERQKLNALVIASGLADEDELRAKRPSSDSNPSRVVARDGDIGTPRASFSLNDLDEFGDDASYYGKEMHPLFTHSPLSSGSNVMSLVSKGSISSSVEDLRSKRSSSSKSSKSKGGKIKSFISRFSSNSSSSNGNKSVLSLPADEKSIRRQRSHSDVLESVAGCSSVSSRDSPLPTSWESVSPTPSIIQSATSISISTRYSPAISNDNEDGFNDYTSSRRRHSDEKSPAGTTSSHDDSPLSLTRHSSSSSLTCSGTNKTGLTPTEGLHEDSSSGRENAQKEEKPSASAPRTFRDRMLLKNNGTALSLMTGKNGNKATKPKRKLLVSGIEQGDYKKYEAISSWCEGFGEVTVHLRGQGMMVADFKDVNVAQLVCRLQGRVHIKGAGSVNLSWTTEE